MKVRTFDPTPLDHSGRAERHFWAITEQWTVEEAVGYSTQHENMWWCPSMGYTMNIGHRIFDTKDQALEACRKQLCAKIREMQLALLNLK